MKYLSDKEFADMIKLKPGIVQEVKKHLRDHGMIKPRKQLTTDHIPLFEKICEIRAVERSGWEEAIEKGIASFGTLPSSTEAKNDHRDERTEILLREVYELLKKHFDGGAA